MRTTMRPCLQIPWVAHTWTPPNNSSGPKSQDRLPTRHQGQENPHLESLIPKRCVRRGNVYNLRAQHQLRRPIRMPQTVAPTTATIDFAVSRPSCEAPRSVHQIQATPAPPKTPSVDVANTPEPNVPAESTYVGGPHMQNFAKVPGGYWSHERT